MTAETIDRILADFRTWLEALPDGGEPPAAPPPPAVDLAALAAQFTALRHDVNLQTKATRAVLDQSAEAIKHLAAKPPAADAESHLKPTRKLLIDIADALRLSLREVTRAVESRAESEVEPDPEPPAVPIHTLWQRLTGVAGPDSEWRAWARAMRAHAERIAEQSRAERAHLNPVLAGLADGYTLSLRRVERAFPLFGLEPIECAGEPFDPELMEVVEVIGEGDVPSGTVVEVVRAGYRVNGQVLRFAQVTVAR